MARFTDKGVERLKTTGKRYALTEGEGLYIEVSPKGQKKWMSYYSHNGKRKWLKIGEYPALSLADAREENKKNRKIVQSGGDPAAAQEVLNTAPTVKELFLEWFEKGTDKRGKPWSEGHRRNVHYMFKADVIPAIGNMKVSTVTKRDIRTLLQKIENRAPNQALQVYRRLSRLFNYAAQMDVIEISPMINLEPIGSTSKKDRWLNNREIKTILAKLPKANMAPQTAQILELILRTGQRPSEICGAEKSEMQDEWWIIPGKKAKNGKEHRVYLTSEAKALFGEANEHGLFFPSLRDPSRPVRHGILSKALRRSVSGKEKKKDDGEVTIEIDPFSPHDLRRTCATHLAELGFTDEIIGAVLNHAKRGVTGQHYNLFRYDPQKKQAMESWGRKLAKIKTEDETEKQHNNVIPFPGGIKK